jgi:microcystin-dependent protein
MTGYTRQSAADIVTSNTIQASHFNVEYNLIQSTFDSLTGHNHDGTTGGGAKIPPAGITGLTSTSAGIFAADGANSVNARTLTGTSNEITVTNGTGASGNPTFSLPTALTFTGKTVTGGTFTTPTINVNANVLSIRDNTDTTKVAQFICSTIGTGATRSYTFPNADGTLALTSDLSSGYQPLDATLTALAAYNTNGILTQTSANTFTGRTITGTSNRITLTNGDGVSGNPTIDISSSYVGQATITTLGTVTTGTWTGTTIAVANGGTGQTTYTNGQLLIGNTTGNTLTKATLTAPAAGISITNGTGSITFGLANDLAAVEGLSSTGIATRTATDTWAVRTITGTADRLTVTNGNGVSGNPTLDVSTSLIPIGIVWPFAGAEGSVPTGWLICGGQAVSRTTYAALFAVIGTTYGTGDGSTTFNVPDLRGRMISGKDDMGSSAANRLTNAASGVTGTTLGASGGTENKTLTTNELPAHTHDVVGYQVLGGGGLPQSSASATSSASTTTSSAGSGAAFGIMNPVLVLNYIIKT